MPLFSSNSEMDQNISAHKFDSLPTLVEASHKDQYNTYSQKHVVTSSSKISSSPIYIYIYTQVSSKVKLSNGCGTLSLICIHTAVPSHKILRW